MAEMDVLEEREALESGESPPSVADDIVAAWDFAQEISSNRVVDTGTLWTLFTGHNSPHPD